MRDTSPVVSRATDDTTHTLPLPYVPTIHSVARSRSSTHKSSALSPAPLWANVHLLTRSYGFPSLILTWMHPYTGHSMGGLGALNSFTFLCSRAHFPPNSAGHSVGAFRETKRRVCVRGGLNVDIKSSLFSPTTSVRPRQHYAGAHAC